MKADEILESALDALRQRAALRDQPTGERSAARAAAIFSAWKGREMSEDDAWCFLLCLKMARSEQGKFHLDDYIDLASYPALLGEHRASLTDVT